MQDSTKLSAAELSMDALARLAIIATRQEPLSANRLMAIQGAAAGITLALRHPEYAQALWNAVSNEVHSESSFCADHVVGAVPITREVAK